MRTYAIGDIHGHIELLREVHSWIAADQAKHGAAPIVHVGDLVDRGPDCRGVVEYLRVGVEAGQDWVVLKGNHDRMFTNYIRDINYHDPCLRTDLSYLHPKIGGAATLESYGVKNAADRPLAPVHAEALAAVPEPHLKFLESLPIYYQRGEVIYVHAGIRPGIPIAQQAEDDLVWIRKGFLEDTRDFGALIVHGHTALDAPMHYGNRVNIDSSAAYGGPLTAVVLEGREVFNLTAAGRIAVLRG
ncbi:metallophosphoesterase [Cypionkella sp.]|uniref:metallophosphoesterase n=1 Tax=Cypionkella sp. TaxID=2811411 RepID=UPI0027273C97|nr:metallophosphoesterase [Cypionkella sp.]MDO8984609.1 metallophosphoesterase [Cypionkella sp.]MDP2049362.1 metallophosphoesterase [Cypionkella sp.]